MGLHNSQMKVEGKQTTPSHARKLRRFLKRMRRRLLRRLGAEGADNRFKGWTD